MESLKSVDHVATVLSGAPTVPVPLNAAPATNKATSKKSTTNVSVKEDTVLKETSVNLVTLHFSTVSLVRTLKSVMSARLDIFRTGMEFILDASLVRSETMDVFLVTKLLDV